MISTQNYEFAAYLARAAFGCSRHRNHQHRTAGSSHASRHRPKGRLAIVRSLPLGDYSVAIRDGTRVQIGPWNRKEIKISYLKTATVFIYLNDFNIQ